jgi:hypothetical protein
MAGALQPADHGEAAPDHDDYQDGQQEFGQCQAEHDAFRLRG